MKSDLNNIREDIKNCTHQVTQAEIHVSSNRDEVEILQAKLFTMESKQKTLEDKVMDLETRSRRNKVRLINLVQSTKGRGPCSFFPEVLDISLQNPLVIEKAHWIGPRRDGTAKPHTLIMSFLHYRHKETILTAARAKGDIHYKGQLYLDLDAGVKQLRKQVWTGLTLFDLHKQGLINNVKHQGNFFYSFLGFWVSRWWHFLWRDFKNE